MEGGKEMQELYVKGTPGPEYIWYAYAWVLKQIDFLSGYPVFKGMIMYSSAAFTELIWA